MKLREKYKVREMAGEHIVVLPGRFGADMTRVIALNDTSLWLWNALCGRNFTADEAAQALVENYEVDAATAQRDAAAWIAQLDEAGLLEK